MSEEARTFARARQAAALRAMVSDAAVEDVDLTLAGETLRRKRQRAVARALPALPEALGADYETHFRRYAAERVLPEAGPLADALAFIGWLAATRPLPDTLRLEALALGARWRFAPALAVRRFSLGAARLPEAGRLAIVVRIAARELWLRLPLPPTSSRGASQTTPPGR